MELVGNEKRIQALFREQKLEDERVAPSFVKVWARAQATNLNARRAFRVSFAVVTALLVISLCALAFWARNWQRDQRQNSAVAVGGATPGSTSAQPLTILEPKRPGVAEPRNRARSNRLARKPATRSQAEPTARNVSTSDAVAILNWQSPTATLMQSPADDVLTSLPRLDRSAAELKSFLPNTPK